MFWFPDLLFLFGFCLSCTYLPRVPKARVECCLLADALLLLLLPPLSWPLLLPACARGRQPARATRWLKTTAWSHEVWEKWAAGRARNCCCLCCPLPPLLPGLPASAAGRFYYYRPGGTSAAIAGELLPLS